MLYVNLQQRYKLINQINVLRPKKDKNKPFCMVFATFFGLAVLLVNYHVHPTEV